MNPDARKAIFADTHKAIAETAQAAVDHLCSLKTSSLSYPPGIELTEIEINHLTEINMTPEAKEILKKVIADACSQPIFHMMSLLDGVAEPYVIKIPEWVGGSLGGDDDGLMLHDEFFETYWDYEENKKS